MVRIVYLYHIYIYQYFCVVYVYIYMYIYSHMYFYTGKNPTRPRSVSDVTSDSDDSVVSSTHGNSSLRMRNTKHHQKAKNTQSQIYEKNHKKRKNVDHFSEGIYYICACVNVYFYVSYVIIYAFYLRSGNVFFSMTLTIKLRTVSSLYNPLTHNT
jgi:hypothetical protein